MVTMEDKICQGTKRSTWEDICRLQHRWPGGQVHCTIGKPQARKMLVQTELCQIAFQPSPPQSNGRLRACVFHWFHENSSRQQILRILPQQNTALLSNVRVCVCPCVTGMTSPLYDVFDHTNHTFSESSWSKDIKTDITKCLIHKYTNTNTQIHKYSILTVP